MCNAYNHSSSCACGFGGEGHLGVRGRVVGDGWELHDSGQRLVFFTSCPVCGDNVYFYRDENGCCELFSSLGPPWPVHACWENIAIRGYISECIKSSLKARDFNGHFYRIDGERVLRPGRGGIEVGISGYVCDNQLLYPQPKEFRLPAHRRATSVHLVYLEVVAERNIYPFVLRANDAREIPDFSVVEIRGIWRKKSRRWYLWARSLRIVEPRKRRPPYGTCFDFGGICDTCGCQLHQSVSWGIDDQGLEECCECAEMRGKRSKQKFLAHIRLICKQ